LHNPQTMLRRPSPDDITPASLNCNAMA
jgi:hypothetical protein